MKIDPSALRSGRPSHPRKQLHAAPHGITPRRGGPSTVTTVLGPPAMSATCDRAPGGGRDPLPEAEAGREHGDVSAVETEGPEDGGRMNAGRPMRQQRRRLALAGVRGHVAKGRTFTRQALRDWGWGNTQTSEDTLLVVSELLTNASLHADGCHELVLTATETALRIEIHDGTTVLPVRHPAPHRGVPGGRGLYIVERLSDRWGTHTYGTGKAVWAEITASRLEYGTTVER
ncbi:MULTISPECIES: ATP-binding protein [unclassified Streptomyces]|uniref:ATP-binding protein n=1 Tax=unclassified Streptomyces TaxID=2593676 RepID=UPI0037FADE13